MEKNDYDHFSCQFMGKLSGFQVEIGKEEFCVSQDMAAFLCMMNVFIKGYDIGNENICVLLDKIIDKLDDIKDYIPS